MIYEDKFYSHLVGEDYEEEPEEEMDMDNEGEDEEDEEELDDEFNDN